MKCLSVDPLSISLRATRLSDYESAGVHTFTCASVMLCRYNVLHTEVKTLDFRLGFRFVTGDAVQEWQSLQKSFSSLDTILLTIPRIHVNKRFSSDWENWPASLCGRVPLIPVSQTQRLPSRQYGYAPIKVSYRVHQNVCCYLHGKR